jgi:excisionase family DNA binding protein
MLETKSLTTGQAARYCYVSQPTIVNWIKKGKLKAYATPGGHYRILLADFLSFLKAYDIPIDPALKVSSRPQVLIVGDGLQAARLAQTLQRGNGRFDVALASTDHEASAQVVRLSPDAVVLDMTSAALDCPALCRWLRDSPEGHPISILAVGGPEYEETARAAGVDAYLSITAALQRLGPELEALLARERGKEE